MGEPVFAAPILRIAAQWLNSFHIYAFTLVSGYVFYYLKFEKGSYAAFLPFILSKGKRLLVPYLFVSLVWVIPFAVYFFKYDMLVIIKYFAFGISPNQLWFLLMLFVVFAVFYPLAHFFRKYDIYGATVILLFYGTGLAGRAILPDIFQVFRACMYLVLFWVGFKIRQHGNAMFKEMPVSLWITANVLLFVMVKHISQKEGILFALLEEGLLFVLHVVGAVMAFVLLQKVAGKIPWKNDCFFALLTKNVMPVYLLHQQVVYVFVCCLNGVLNPYLHAMVNFLGAMAVSLLLATILMKFKPTRMLMGEK